MSRFVDIHAHILPGIDDGPEDLDQSLALAQAAVESGTETIAATPHLRPDFPKVHVEELADRCQEVRAAIEERDIPLALVGAAEVSLNWVLEAGDEQLALASYGQRGTDLLIETPMMTTGGIEPMLSHLLARGYRITLAHPERGPMFRRDDNRLRALVDQGVLLQVNADSLVRTGRSSPVGRFARHLCTEGLAHALASDGHRAAEWRPVTALGQAAEALASIVGPERAAWMTQAAPAAIAHGTELPAAPAVEPQRRRLFGLR